MTAHAYLSNLSPFGAGRGWWLVIQFARNFTIGHDLLGGPLRLGQGHCGGNMGENGVLKQRGRYLIGRSSFPLAIEPCRRLAEIRCFGTPLSATG